MPHDRVVLPPGLVCGQLVPDRIDVGVYSPVLHRRAEIFGADVDTFRPERWLSDEEKARKMKNAMLTFSRGKYNCLGKHIARMGIAKLVSSMMRAFTLLPQLLMLISHHIIPSCLLDALVNTIISPKIHPLVIQLVIPLISQTTDV
jgi:hypothetical protein